MEAVQLSEEPITIGGMPETEEKAEGFVTEEEYEGSIASEVVEGAVGILWK